MTVRCVFMSIYSILSVAIIVSIQILACVCSRKWVNLVLNLPSTFSSNTQTLTPLGDDKDKKGKLKQMGRSLTLIFVVTPCKVQNRNSRLALVLTTPQ